MAPPFSSWDTGRVVPDGVSTFHLSFTYLLDIMLLTDKILETGILTTELNQLCYSQTESIG